MAANLPFSCVKCNKRGGILFCNGCNRTLCFEHVNQHKNEIEQNFEDLINNQRQLENDLYNNQDSNILFCQIDQWKKESIEQIKQIAKKTKEDLRELIKQSNEQLLKDLINIKENIRLIKESEDLSEIELIKLTNQFYQLKDKINSFQLIKSSNSNDLKIEKLSIDQPPLPPPPSSSSISRNKSFSYIEQIEFKQEGSIIITEIDRYGYFIKIENIGLTTEDMCGWIIKRSIDSSKDIIYRFPNDFTLKSKSFVKILSRQASETLYSYETTNILIGQSFESWGIGGNTITNSIIDPNGNEKHILIEK